MLTMFLDKAAATTAQASGGQSALFWIVYIALFGGIFYFLLIRPQKKQQKQQDTLRNSIQPGDNIMTTGGFYGVVLDVVDDTVIVEFGNNKNCRIPMHKNAIAEIEKSDADSDDTKK